MSHALNELREYVLKDTGIQNKSNTIVSLYVTHENLKTTKFLEIRFHLTQTIYVMKEKLMTHCGTNCSAMRLFLICEDDLDLGRFSSNNGQRASLNNNSNQNRISLSDDTKMLGYYSPRNGMRLHVVDVDPNSMSANGWLEDVSKVEKYVMSDEAYGKREGTYRRWANKKREEDPSWTLQKEQIKMRQNSKLAQRQQNGEGKYDDDDDDLNLQKEEKMAEYESIFSVSKISLDSRCEVNPGAKRGVVCFIGKVQNDHNDDKDDKNNTNENVENSDEMMKKLELELEEVRIREKDIIDIPTKSLPRGYWVGVKFDEPVGKNDGKTPCGMTLIPNCPPMFGSFLRPDRVTCGDFPEIDEFASSDEDEI